ncbi:MAG: hypothetical protein DWQ34_07290 [Planctomycetota bacterium]|nr:MAG: hypothetical protein DWQ34_07290 [Planctomycetota bacterium]REJ95272.1 MAG: hypothetical protein DWQ29_02155 [Planctomycetota bacterium]REK23425.1 MAG: hypothetical protein DWQ41_16880 [Planctomycetota bacterium]REK38938.1 MAG: hypothetical protein DWQ45_03590 [Planctomycetota bacterium]
MAALALACVVVGAVQAGDDGELRAPLDRLRTRSATNRWNAVRDQWTPLNAPFDGDGLTTERNAPDDQSQEPAAASAGSSPAAPRLANRLPTSAAESVDVNSARRDDTAGERSAGESEPRAATDVSPRSLPEGESSPESRPRLSVPNLNRGVRLDRAEPAVSIDQRSSRQFDDLQEPSPAPPSPVTIRLFDDSGDESSLSQARRDEEDTALRPISQIEPFRDYSPDGKDPCQILCPKPDDCEDDGDSICPPPYDFAPQGSTERLFPHLDYCWAASDLYHNPLYFEDPTLERYGHVRCNEFVQPFSSMGRFSFRFLTLPYQVALDPVCRRHYALGWYRPGEPAPKLNYQIPWNAKATATAAGVYTGLFFLIP